MRSESAWNMASALSSSASVTPQIYNHLVVCQSAGTAGIWNVRLERPDYVIPTGRDRVDVGIGAKGFDAVEHRYHALAQLLLI